MFNQIFTQLSEGGILMIPLLICSFIAIIVIVEKLFGLRTKKIMKPEVITILDNIKSYEDLPIALAICNEKSGVLGNIMKIILENPQALVGELKEDLVDAGRQEVRVLERGLGTLETIAAVTPILGLLGTVLGMIKVFKVIALNGVGNAAALSGGISEALLTTAVGLIIGVPSLIFYNYFTSKAENMVLDIEKIANDLIKKVKKFNGESR